MCHVITSSFSSLSFTLLLSLFLTRCICAWMIHHVAMAFSPSPPSPPLTRLSTLFNWTRAMTQVSCSHTLTPSRSHTLTLSQDYKPEWDPSKFHSVKTGRGPLGPNWKEECNPVMCCYKLVEVEFKWWGLQGTVESKVIEVEYNSNNRCTLHNFSM